MSNMISLLRKQVQENGKAEIDIDMFNQLQNEWITRCDIDCLPFVYKNIKTNEERKILLTAAEIRPFVEDELYERLTACDCTSIGETNVIECNCEDKFEDFELQLN
ncbi:hypothetical protein [Aliivibrio fischeri]|uniref:hypothetical protein n=1 Tax=Aliivibrio fischeri TaxID=668 RepID=UPI0007C478B2|nr:hypothetical protein [Aliivibrio fischeri]